MGDAAPLVTNELIPKRLFEKMRAQKPNGYLIGVGLGLVLTLVEAFPERPRGIFLVDTNAAVAALGQKLIQALQQAESFEDIKPLIHLVREGDVEKLGTILQIRDETLLRKTFQKATYAHVNCTDEPYCRYPKIEETLQKHFKLFQTLARENAFCFLHADITDPALLNYLPDATAFRNILYISNLWDWGIPVHTICIPFSLVVDTLRSLCYWLRVSDQMPTFCQADFKEQYTIRQFWNRYTPSRIAFDPDDALEPEAILLHFGGCTAYVEKLISLVQPYLTKPDLFAPLTPEEWLQARFGETILRLAKKQLRLL